MPPATTCPSAELLRRSLDPDDPLPAAERQRIEAHVDRCTEGCKTAIDVLLRGNTQLVGPATAGPGNAPAAAPSECPARLGRYRIVGQLGSGGFGTVYRGYDDDLRRDVAVKAPHRHRIATAQDAEAYLAEARTVAGLDHPHIVPVFDLGRTADGLCFVVSRFIEGGDLSRRIHEARPSFATAASLTAAVAEALHHAHKHGLVHRDVKPGNILIDLAGEPFLTDFGLALTEADYGKGGGLAGTPAYMSPEQANGEGHRVDGRSDVFSLGVVLYELLTGRRPFRADTVAEILGQITGVEARPPRQIDDAIPMELERICLKALAKRASERYTTARDMADDLRQFLAATAAGNSELTEGRRSGAALALTLSAPAPASDSRPLQVVPKGLRAFDAHDADFFLELLPGPRDREGLPDSIRFWKTHIEETDPDDTFAVGLLYGPSGCGKSSLVKAGLLPRLSGDVIAVYVEATAGETETRLLNGLRKRCPALSADLGLKETLAALRRGQGIPAAKKVLIILDQFEQWLHAKKEETNTQLVQALRQCDGGRVQCVVMVRDDFWMAATRFMRELEIRLLEGQNSAAVDLFDGDHARNVLAAFGRAFGKLPEKAGETGAEQKEFLNQAASALSQENKVVCVRLALFADMMKGRPWTPAALKEVGGAEGVGVTFLEETFAAAAPPEHRRHQKAARAVLQALLPESGTDIKGHMRSRGELLAASGYSGRFGDFDDLIRILDGEIRLLTPTDPEGADDASSPLRVGERYYQLTHDYLVPSLREWLTRKQKETRRGRAELLLADRSAVWNARPENRQLPSLWQWLQVRWLTRKKNWTPPQKRMMRKATGHHVVRLLAAVVLLVLVGWGAFEGYGRLKAQALRDRLLNANTADAPLVVSDMAPYRRWTDPLLREAYQEAEANRDTRKQLLSSVALLPTDPGQVDYLYRRLLDAEPQEVDVLVRGLSNHKGELIERLWAVVERPERGQEGQRLRAVCALAAYDPDGARWDKASGPAVEQLVSVNPVFLGPWMDALRPVRARLVGPLGDVFRDRQEKRAAERMLATNILADYAADQPGQLAELLLDADEKQFAVIYPKFREQGERGPPVLNGEMDRKLPPDAKDDAKERLAKRQANAAAALLRMSRPEKVWPLLRRSAPPDDPRTRSYLIHRLGRLGNDPAAVVRRLDEVPEVSIRRALLLSLGEFGPDQLGPAAQEELVPKLLQLYRDDPDPGLHGAAEWLLRRWKRQAQVQRMDQDLATGKVEGGRGWYINSQGQTLVVVARPAEEFLVGSPPTEAGREGGPEGKAETPHPKRIGRSFAVAAKEVTVEQFCRCPRFKQFAYEKQYAPTVDCPVNQVSWYEAAAYCNWLTQQELPKDQWESQSCYLPNAAGEYAEGMKQTPNCLERAGYRLPSEAEWEYACRAGAVTSRYYGETEELLGEYAWYTKNTLGKEMSPGGSLKPNDLGLFDMLGDAFEWCQGRAALNAAEVGDGEDNSEIKDNESRVLRGGSFDAPASYERAAYRLRVQPSTRFDDAGFRLARTFR